MVYRLSFIFSTLSLSSAFPTSPHTPSTPHNKIRVYCLAYSFFLLNLSNSLSLPLSMFLPSCEKVGK